MGQMIQKPETNPYVTGVANLFLPGLGYFLMGQQRKAMYTFGAYAVAWLLSCCGIGFFLFPVLALVSGYDAFLLGQKLQSGQSIGENENGLEFLDKVFKD